ncbi:MAG: hypothetical protein A2754_01405 [Candidatus Magasanikbacteria bacterium RIFCSPHIGHO2_01_FULL_47_8]|uniref:Band 7 domain-containing protein n=1 Tax=Candidatus Magasanikbacteria bacterium RIFCSPHIGHO2_01_FULL_47_8 TaxID=1798673 RepID=A0A1F6MCV6_9BACT|nr:MAG: hypothetical protein A2754_01405 [Candidatus Magasanikbacteria bacterium RIFCSPHIGHO2_01_FULL_47_8]
MRSCLLWIVTVAMFAGCSSEDIPQAHKGRMFDRTGALAFYSGGAGLTGPILGPGTHYTGVYDELRVVDCAMATTKEPLKALTKDGVQFGIDIYIRYGADPSDESVKAILGALGPDKEHTVTSVKLYDTYVRPAIGEAVRETVSPFRANDVNDKREEILSSIRKRFLEMMEKKDPKAVTVYEVNLSNLTFPDEMNHANTERAVQGVLKDKAIAERERVTAEIQTMSMRRELAEKEGEAVGAKIDKIGAALKRNPEYLQYDLQAKMPEIYRLAGDKGNMIITAPSPSMLMLPKTMSSGK